MTLTNKSAIALFTALQRMDGVNDTPFKFGAKVRYSLAKNLRLLSRVRDDVNAARVALIKEISSDGDIRQNTPEMKQFTQRFEELLDLPVEIPNLMRFQFGELNLDVNAIPVTVLADLGPIIIEEDGDAQA